MAGTNGMIITNKGLSAVTAAEGGDNLLFTKIVIGQGEPPAEQDISTLLNVVEPIEILPVIKFLMDPENYTATVGAYFTNQGRADGFDFREVGVFANTQTTGEVLFAYGNAGDEAEYIPASGSYKIVEKSVDAVITVGSAQKITALIDSGVWARAEDLAVVAETANGADEKADRAIEAIENLEPCPPEGCPALQALAARVARLEQAVYDDMTSNPFAVSFANLGGKTIEAGNWNTVQGRLEC